MEEFWQPSPHSVICSDHFKKEDFYLTKKGFRKLNKKAWPVLLIPKLNNSEKRNHQSKSKFTPSKGKRKDISLRSLVEELRNKGSIKEDLYFELSKNFVAGDLSNKLKDLQIKRQKQKISSEYVPKQSFNLRKFCLSLQFYSPSAYNQARFALGYDLPHPRTLNKWYERTDANAGFAAEAFKILKEKSSKENLVCSLIVGEMAIRQQKMWTGKKYEGLVNNGFGSDDNGDLASQAYVLMVVSLSENWKLPVGYFLIKSLTAEQRANVIKICLQKCHDNGVRIVSLTFDACNANLCAGTVLGCNLNDHENLKVTFPHPSTGKEIVIFPDPCRMLKLVHKVFVIKRVLIDRDGRFIKWDYLDKLDSLQGNKQLHFCDKSKLVFYENQLMKVRLATQLLNKSVADTLKFCEMHMKLNDFAGCAATSDFIYVMNNLFDVLTSNYQQKDLKEPLSLRSEKSVIEFLDFAKTYIASLKMNIYTKQIIKFGSHPVLVRTKEKQKLLIESKRKIGFIGLLCCIESVKILHKNLLNSKILDRIPFQRLSQNHLESFFVDLRQHTGTSNDPNAVQFKDGYRKFLNVFRKSSNFIENTIPFTYIAIRVRLSSVSIINSTFNRLRFNEDDFTYVIRPDYGDKTETGNCEIFSETLDSGGYRFVEDVKQIVGYISGWVVTKLNKQIKCEECVDSLMASEKLPFHKLISSKNASGLMYPSLDVFIICRRVESVICDLIKRNDRSIFVCRYTLDYIKCSALKGFINSEIFNSLNEHSFNQSALANHRLHLIRAIIYQYVDIRLLYVNKSLSVNMSKWKINNKLVLFERQ